jgi:membrane protein required for colicin V production
MLGPADRELKRIAGGSPVNGLDIVFAFIISIALLRGLWRGMIREISSLLALGVGLVLAGRYAHDCTPYVLQIVGNQQVSAGLSYVGLFLASFVGVVLLGSLVRKFMHAVFLGWADQMVGALLGLAKGVVLCCLILFVLTFALSPRSSLVAESRLAPYLNQVTQKMVVIIPEGLKQSFADKSRELQNIWKSNHAYPQT